MPRKKIHEALDRLAAEEKKFLGAQFLAPVVRGGGGRVQVRIAGVICDLRVTPRDFEGFGVFEPASHSAARLRRPAPVTERRKYLGLFPRALVIISSRPAGATTAGAVPSNAADARFSVEGEIALQLIGEVDLFDTVAARFDGRQF